MRGLLLLLAAGAALGEERAYRFAWEGGGYRLSGVMVIDASRPSATEADVSCFVIQGFEGRRPIGSWRLEQLTADTPWTLNFDTAAERFRVGGLSYGTGGQEWNMSGDLTGCGAGGFGFNAGSSSQELCLDNEAIMDSMVGADAPISVKRIAPHEAAACIPQLS